MILLATIALVGIGYTLIEIAYNFINKHLNYFSHIRN